MSSYNKINKLFDSMLNDISYIKLAHFTRVISQKKKVPN